MWSADPEQMWTFPARFLVEFFDNHGMLGLARPAAVAHGRGRLEALRRGAHRAVRGPHPALARPVRAIERFEDRVEVTPAAASPSLRRGRDRRPRRPGAGDARRPDAGRARDPRRLPLPGQRGGAAHRPRACCRAAGAHGRAGTTTSSRDASRSGHRHLPHEPPAVAGRRATSTSSRSTARRRSTRRGSSARSPTRTRSTRVEGQAAQRRYDEVGGRNRTHYCGAYWGWGFHEDGVASAHRAVAARRPRGGAGMTASAFYEGTVAPPPLRGARARVPPPDLDGLPRPRRAAGGCRWPPALPARATTSATRARPLQEVVREIAGPDAPRGPGARCSPTCARSGTASTPSASTTSSRPTARRVGAVVAEVTNTPWGERHAYVLRRERRRARAGRRHGQARCTSRRSWAWTSATRCARAEPGPTLSVHIENREDGEQVFDATLNLERRPLDRRGAARATTARRCAWSR